MDERLESWIAAERLIAQYGPEAANFAEERATSRRADGDPKAADMWLLIYTCVRELQAGRAAQTPAVDLI